MRQVNRQVASGANTGTVTGIQIDANQLINASFHFVIGDSTAAGNCVIQASNDVFQIGPFPFTVTNWATVSTTAQAAGTTQVMVQLSNISYRWLRAVWTETTPGTTTTKVNMEATGV